MTVSSPRGALVTAVALVALALAVGGCDLTSYETTIEQICPQGGMGVKTEVRTKFYGHAVHRARVKDAAAKALAECADVVPQAPAKRPL